FVCCASCATFRSTKAAGPLPLAVERPWNQFASRAVELSRTFPVITSLVATISCLASNWRNCLVAGSRLASLQRTTSSNPQCQISTAPANPLASAVSSCLYSKEQLTDTPPPVNWLPRKIIFVAATSLG